MPLYEFQCNKCGNKQEVLQRFDDPAPEVCSACAANNSMQRAVSASAFHLKGGGWYNDLYASTPKNNKTTSKPAKKD